MWTFAQKARITESTVTRQQPAINRNVFQQQRQENVAVPMAAISGASRVSGSYNFSQIKVFAGDVPDAETSRGRIPRNGSLDNAASGHRFVTDKEPKGPKKDDAAVDKKKEDTPAAAKQAGVDSFWVNWDKGPSVPDKAKLRLDFQAKFKDDATHDPALAEFRQSVSHDVKITTSSGDLKRDTKTWQDDHYSRADDKGGHDIHDIYFLGNDNPGPEELDANDVVDYRFTAEQHIIDLSRGNKVIAKLGPYTAGIKGKHPREPWGVPKKIGS